MEQSSQNRYKNPPKSLNIAWYILTMQTAHIQQIIHDHQHELAFIAGNGINRYPDNPNALSWDDLLNRLWDRIFQQTVVKRPSGISFTEVYDILDLENINDNLQKLVTDMMRDWALLHITTPSHNAYRR